jgi:ADP-ribose pyrophosphatase
MSSSLTRVVAAVIERGNRVLVALRPLEKRHGGMWEFPGGKVEGAETDLDALQRELSEELGLRVVTTSSPLAVFQDPGSQFLIVFVPVVADGEPECREHVAIRWVPWPDLAALPLAPTDHRFVVARDMDPKP